MAEKLPPSEVDIFDLVANIVATGEAVEIPKTWRKEAQDKHKIYWRYRWQKKDENGKSITRIKTDKDGNEKKVYQRGYQYIGRIE